MVRLHLTVLGGFQGRLDSGLALTFPTRKSQALVAYLALPLGRSHPRDKLAALLWGDLAQPQARGGLRQALSRLRRTVATEPPAVLLDGDHVALNPAVVDVDAFEFERLIEQGTPDALERACALYGGDLLEGFALSEPAFEEWLLAERERLRELALEALARLLRHHCTAGSREAALPTALRLVALDPLQESVHRALMRLYVEVGRRPAALRQYQICVGALHRELGVEPEAATKQLYQDILRQRPARLTTDAEGAGASGQPDTPRHTDESALSRELPLVGREAETLRLREALDDAWTGRGRTVAVVGEAGVGKSRLVAEIAAEAFARQGRVLVGRCYEAEQILPFGPWVDALRAARLDVTDPALESLTLSCRAELARLLPELRRPGQEAAPGPADYRQLFESVAQLLRRLALPQPLMIVIEDLHWADEISLRLLSFLGRRIAGGPILLVATARNEDLAGAPMLRRTLEDLGPNLVQMPLLPLSKAETLALVRVLARRGSHETAVTGLADQIWRVSEGNPFVVVETVRALPEETRPEPVATVTVPRRVREVIVRHHEGLSARGRELTALAAAIGREFDFSLLSRSAGLDEGEAAATVEELVRRRVLHNVGEQFDFTHDRIREVVYQSLLRERQRTLHARIAGTIEQLYADRLDDHVERLADHAARGALHDKAVVYLRQAGAKAFSNSAHAEALGYFMHALEVLEKLAPGVDRDREELALRLALGPTLQVTRGHAAPEVEENYRRTRELSGRVGGPVQQFQALWGLWLASSYRASSTTALQLGRELLALAEGSGDAALLLEGHHALWPVLVWLGHLKEARRHAELGMALYDKAEHRSHAFVYGGHDPGMCCAKYASWALWLLGYPARSLEYSAASLRLAEELAHPPAPFSPASGPVSFTTFGGKR